MDTSEVYIRQCDCGEIQNHEPSEGDWYLAPHDTGFNKIRGMGGIFCHDATIDPADHGIDDSYIFLPTQSQLQEMVDIPSPKNLVEVYDFAFQNAMSACSSCINEKMLAEWQSGGNFYKECIKAVGARYGSMEQLWLAFVMSQLYQKTWSGTEWINEV